MKRIKFWPGYIVFSITAILFVLISIASIRTECLAFADDDNVPTDSCYRQTISVTNDTGGTITNKPVRVIVDSASAVANGWMNDRGWDIVPSTTGNTEVEMMTQDLTDLSSAWWMVVPSLATGSTQNFVMYLGNAQASRDNGIYFDTADLVTAVDDPAFDIANNLTMTVELDVLDITGQTALLVGHFDVGDGYRMRFVDNGGVLDLQAQVDGFTISATWPGVAGGQETVRMRFVAAAGTDFFLEHFTSGAWSALASADTDLAAISAPATGPAFTWGGSLADTTVRNTLLEDGSGIVAHWLFDGIDGTETSAVAPNYTGTFPDISAASHTATYAFNRDISQTPAIVGPVELNSAPQIVTITKTGATLLGDIFAGRDLGAAVTANENVPFFNIIQTSAEDSGLPITTLWEMLFLFIAIGVLSIGTLITRQYWVGATLATLPVFYGTINQLIQPWFIILWLAAILMVFGVGKWAEGK